MTQQTDRLTDALSERYRLDRELGAGGMVTVYLAHDLKHERDVAIKVLHPDLGAALGGERFLTEIRTTARLQHPHILPLLDRGEADGLLYYVMPLVTGKTLRARLERERQLPVADAVRIAREVASALDYAHRQNVIHRDIMPENILLHDGSPLVADFGIALAVQSAGGARMTQTGLSLGTPQYMSPEKAMGERTIDARSDIYALGAVTYEMLAGDTPFTGSNMQAIVAKVLTEKPTSLHTLRDTVPPYIEHAVFTALAKLPADRYESARAFADALSNSAFQISGNDATRLQSAVNYENNNGWKFVALTLGFITVVTAGAAAWAVTRSSADARDIGVPPTTPMRMEDTYRNFAVAHDGSFMVYEAKIGESSQLWYRSLSGAESHVIVGTDGALGTPRISPDDKRVAFVANGDLKIASMAGGEVMTSAPTTDPHGGGWFAKPNQSRYIRRANAGVSSPLLLGSDFRIIDDRYLVYMSLDGTISATRFENRDSLIVGRSVAQPEMDCLYKSPERRGSACSRGPRWIANTPLTRWGASRSGTGRTRWSIFLMSAVRARRARRLIVCAWMVPPTRR